MRRTATPLLLVLLVALPLAGWLAAEEATEPDALDENAATSPEVQAAALEPQELVWKGYARVGAADVFAHTRETEVVVAPFARMGFILDLPEGAEALAFRLQWPGGARMHVMAHHHPEGATSLPTYMSGWPDSGEACVRIPKEDVLPGVWMVMAHAERTAVNVDFTITAEVVSPPGAAIRDGPHGHPMDEDWEADMREPLPCE